MSPNPRIAVIGAGPAGTTLARLLLVSKIDIDITIFEGEASLDVRTQGGTLDLHTDTGIAALKKAGLYDEFLKRVRFDGEAFTVCNKDLKRFIHLSGTKEGSTRGRPEIDRQHLREILNDAIPQGMIKWNHRLRRVTIDSAGKPILHFDHTTETGFDLVVGADGAWSKVRPLLSEATPYYAGVAGANFKINDVEHRQPELSELVDRGSLFAFGDSKSLIAQQLSENGAITIASWSTPPENWQKELDYDPFDPKAAKAGALKLYSDWDPRLKAFIENADDDFAVPRNLYMLPVGHKWQHKPYLTLLGDAAHLMTPFAGEGVNLAMTDAMRLADRIIAACTTLSPSASPEERVAQLSREVKAFEEDMFARATKVQAMTENMMNAMFFMPGAPNYTIENWVSIAASDSLPWGTGWIAYVLAKAYFTFWRWRNL